MSVDKMNSQKKNTFSHNQLWPALREGWDIFDRLMIPGFVMGETAKSVFDGTDLTGDKVTFGIRKADYTDTVKGLIRQIHPDAVLDDKSITYVYEGIPVEIRVIYRKYGFLEHLDKKIYLWDEYNLPNPFDKYYKARFIVQ